jgi:hypothetical protein
MTHPPHFHGSALRGFARRDVLRAAGAGIATATAATGMAGGVHAAVAAAATPGSAPGASAEPGQRTRNATRTLPWIDAHVHLQSPEWFRASIFPRRRRSNRRRRAQPLGAAPPAAVSREAEAAASAAGTRRYGPGIADQAQRFVDQMDDAGIDVAVLFAMDFDYTGEKLNLDHEGQVAALAEVRDRFPGRFVLFAAVDPRRGRAGVEMLRRVVAEHGVAGMGEFAPHFFGFAPNDRERCYPIYEACAELNLPIAPNCSIVASHVSRWCDPIYFEDVAHDFPDINISLTSAGKPHWEETAIALAASKHNVFLDIGDWQHTSNSDPVGHVLRFVRRALDTDARHRIMFGSDFPVYARQYSERRWVEVFTVEAARHGVAFSDEDLDLFFSDNAQEFLDADVPMPPPRAG